MTKFLEFLSEKLVKTIKMQRSHAQGVMCDLICYIVDQLKQCQWPEGLPKFEEPPLHFTVGGPLHPLKLALGN